MINSEIQNKALLRALKKEGLEDMKLIRGAGYFYWMSNTNRKLGLALVNAEVVLVCYFHHLSIVDWVQEAKEAYQNAMGDN